MVGYFLRTTSMSACCLILVGLLIPSVMVHLHSLMIFGFCILMTGLMSSLLPWLLAINPNWFKGPMKIDERCWYSIRGLSTESQKDYKG